ncbi:MAG: DUF5018 domain-containing protein [Bacteroidia bacterium]|nr:DUF5018 domain-containing protein [Bacteroidia bacterium]
MKKTGLKFIAGIALCFVATELSFGQATDLFISEYIEGASFNKAIEIYNGTSAPVDLTHYSLEKDVNGNGTFAYTFTFIGLLADGDVYVISRTDANAAIVAVSDTFNSNVINFNGDDQVRLLKDGVEIDRIGITGGTNFAIDVTLVRKPTICSPSSGEQNPATNGQWNSYAANTFTYLGSHSADCGIGPNDAAEILSFELAEQMSSAIINSITTTVDIDVIEGTVITNLTPTIVISSGATIAPASGVSQNFTNPVHYIVTAENGTTTKDWTVAVNVVMIDTVTVYNIQYTTDISGDSPYMGSIVNTTGTVSAKKTGGYWIQDGSGAWNGIYIYDNTHNPAVGDNITITGTADEYYEVTEIKTIIDYSLNSSGNSVNSYIVQTGTVGNEQYESVLLKVENADCTNDSAGNGMWEVNDGSGPVLIDDLMYAFTPSLGTSYNITGILNYYSNQWMLEPRNINDISIAVTITSADTVRVAYYNLLNYPDSDPQRYLDYKKIFQNMLPDLLIVNELQSSSGGQTILDNVLNTDGITHYSKASFINGPDSDNLLFYNNEKFGLVSQEQISTDLRDISRYKVYFKSADLPQTQDTIYLNLFGCHLKADNSSENQRLTEIMEFFFFFHSAYPLFDPGQAEEWHNNINYCSLHTQSTRDSDGGMDDRFDFIFFNNEIYTGGNNVFYLNGSYKPYGNDGTCQSFNNSINAFSNIQYSQDILDALYNGSDHLPVTAQIVISDTISNLSSLADIVSFTLAEQAGPAVISSLNATVTIEVAEGTNLTNLVPTIAVSTGATISPASSVAQDFTNPVIYMVTAENGTIKSWTVTVTVGVAGTTIYDIQYTTDISGNSPLMGDTVTVTGIVTSLHYQYAGGAYKGYFIQEAAGAWHGVYVYDNAHTPVVGDEVTLTATVSEYNGLTELTNVTSLTVNSSANTLPATVTLNTGDVDESYEGVLIKVEEALCLSLPDGFGVWTINSNNTGVLSVDDDIYEFTPAVGIIYNISGIGHYSYSAYKILPRDASDFTGIVGTDISSYGITLFPNPVSDRIYLQNIKDIQHILITNILGQQVIKIDNADRVDVINVENLQS